jgi:cytoskeletal protein RodZ
MVPPLPAPAPVMVPDGTAWSGEVLKKIREARGISVQQISERTRVTRHHIEHIEGDRFHLLPAPVYLRGILLSIARELRLDGQKVARSYLERAAAASAPPAPAPKPR